MNEVSAACSTEWTTTMLGIQGSDGLCFTLEPLAAVRVGGKRRRQDLDRDLAFQPRILSKVDLAHAACA